MPKHRRGFLTQRDGKRASQKSQILGWRTIKPHPLPLPLQMPLERFRCNHLNHLMVEAQDEITQPIEFMVDPALEVEDVVLLRIFLNVSFGQGVALHQLIVGAYF